MIAVAIFSAAPKVYAQSEFITRHMPYDAFDKLPATIVKVEGGTLLVAFAPGTLTLPNTSFISWIAKSARAVSIYYGRFPVPSARILLVPVEGKGVSGGKAFGYKGAAVRLLIGRDSTETDLVEDWQAVHEMIHLALPEVGDQHLWLSEGLAVYVESIARVQAGDLTEAKIWGEFVRDMPQGLPEAADKGLDHTPSWGRTYWGGALFCLLADVEFRKRTANSKGVQEATRGVLASGGNMERDWPIEQVFYIADNAAGVPVLMELYEKMRASPAPTDLGALWRDLGISVRDGVVTFDDEAPLSGIRRAITQAPGAAKSSLTSSGTTELNGRGEAPAQH